MTRKQTKKRPSRRQRAPKPRDYYVTRVVPWYAENDYWADAYGPWYVAHLDPEKLWPDILQELANDYIAGHGALEDDDGDGLAPFMDWLEKKKHGYVVMRTMYEETVVLRAPSQQTSNSIRR